MASNGDPGDAGRGPFETLSWATFGILFRQGTPGGFQKWTTFWPWRWMSRILAGSLLLLCSSVTGPADLIKPYTETYGGYRPNTRVNLSLIKNCSYIINYFP